MSAKRIHFALALLGAAPGCRPSSHSADDTPRAAMRVREEKAAPAPGPLVRCFPGDTGGAPARPLDSLLDRAEQLFDQEHFAGALTCAEEATRAQPRSIEAHHERAAALRELGRFDESRDAFTRALALDPDDPETLASAADLYLRHLPPSNDSTETGLEYARRGSARVRRTANHSRPAKYDRGLVARLALLEGLALNDLGRSREALARLDAALANSAPSDELLVRYERSLALFELCKFDEAKAGFLAVLAKRPGDAWAHQYLGLTLERLGDAVGAERELERAAALAPNDFKPPVLLSAAEFRQLVQQEATRLPAALSGDFSRVHLETADLPALDDLTAEEPPLSPTILGLFRGAPLGDPRAAPNEQRSIVLYRKNLARTVATREELERQVRTTLYHELGHLHGEDDEALRARGLE